MTPERFKILCHRYAAPKSVACVDEGISEQVVALVCGHTRTVDAHVSVKPRAHLMRCPECAESLVKERHYNEFEVAS